MILSCRIPLSTVTLGMMTSSHRFNCHNNYKLKITDHPMLGALMSSDTPNDMEPMKSFRVVRSQSHTSTDRRRSLSDAFSLLNTSTKGEKQRHVRFWSVFLGFFQRFTSTCGLTRWRIRSSRGWERNGWSSSSVWSHSLGRGWAWVWRRGLINRLDPSESGSWLHPLQNK